jgi:hypothetical protein
MTDMIEKILIEDVAFIEQEFAADHLVARGGVAHEIDAANEELPAFVGGDGDIHLIGVGNAPVRRAPARNPSNPECRSICAGFPGPCAAYRWRKHRPRAC